MEYWRAKPSHDDSWSAKIENGRKDNIGKCTTKLYAQNKTQ